MSDPRQPPDQSTTDAIYPCVGICLPDANEAYCLGCGRPWGEPVKPPSRPDAPEPDDAPPA